jgi:hypothetical protein
MAALILQVESYCGCGVWVSNSDPKIIGRWYLDYLYESKILPTYLRLDKGTETGIMATMHAFLRGNHGDMDPDDTVIYGPSTSNQVSKVKKYILCHVLC